MTDPLDEARARITRRPTPRQVLRVAWPIIIATAAWLWVELAGAFSTRPGDTFTEVFRWLMGAHPVAAWTLAALSVAVCLWLPPHFVLGVDWRWLVWAAAVCVVVALSTYGLLSAGLLIR